MMRVLKKLYRLCQITGQVFKQDVHRFLCRHRASPHGTTKLAPAELIFLRRTFLTRLPARVIPPQLDFEELEKNMQIKAQADGEEGPENMGHPVGMQYL